MNKKTLGIAAVLLFTFALSASAEELGAGCGLGKQLFKGQKGLVPHVMAATTNGTSGNQTFGLSSETSGCDADGVILNDRAPEAFVEVNFDNLYQDMAQGNGQYLHSLATLMGCGGVFSDFAGMTRAKLPVLLEGGTSDTLLLGIKREIAADPKLSAGCTPVS